MKFRKFEFESRGGSWSVFMRDFEGGVVDEVFQHIIMGVFSGGEISCFSGGNLYFLGGITSLQITLHCNVPFFSGGEFSIQAEKLPPPPGDA